MLRRFFEGIRQGKMTCTVYRYAGGHGDGLLFLDVSMTLEDWDEASGWHASSSWQKLGTFEFDNAFLESLDVHEGDGKRWWMCWHEG